VNIATVVSATATGKGPLSACPTALVGLPVDLIASLAGDISMFHSALLTLVATTDKRGPSTTRPVHGRTVMPVPSRRDK